MMTNRQTFRFGELTVSSGNLPSPQAIDNRISPGNMASRGPKNLEEGARNVSGVLSHNGQNYYYFTYVSEIVTDDVELDSQGNDRPLQVQPRRTMRFFYFDDGSFIFESNEDLPNSRPIGFLLQQSTVTDSDFDIFDDIDSNYMSSRYHQSNEIRRVDFDDVGTSGTPSGQIDQLIQEIGEEADNLGYSTGHYHNNLKQAQLVTEFVNRSNITALSLVKPSSSSTVFIKDTARVTTSFPENATPSAEATSILNDTYEILDHLR